MFPREAALLQVLTLINHAEIEPLWQEDETIGWIYQYFNSKEERKAMRDASQAPRNSRELAVRNQFFTPPKAYPRSKNDLLAIFVERGLQLLHTGGRIGAITSRTCFFLSSFQKWREQVVLGVATPEVMADLGYGVMDDAMVEAAAYCLMKNPIEQA